MYKQSTSRKSLDDTVARQLLKTLCYQGGRCQFDQASWQNFYQTGSGQSTHTTTIGDFLNRFKQLFDYTQTIDLRGLRTDDVQAQVQLGLCQDYCSRAGCTRHGCDKLHCCKYFLFGPCKFDDDCTYGHELRSSPHNGPLLRDHLMDELDPLDIGQLIKWSGRSTPLVTPRICKFYNNAGGCERGEEGIGCQALHLCNYYVTGACKFGRNCKRSHNVYDKQPKFLLQKYGIDVQRPPSACLEELRKMLGASAVPHPPGPRMVPYLGGVAAYRSPGPTPVRATAPFTGASGWSNIAGFPPYGATPVRATAPFSGASGWSSTTGFPPYGATQPIGFPPSSSRRGSGFVDGDVRLSYHSSSPVSSVGGAFSGRPSGGSAVSPPPTSKSVNGRSSSCSVSSSRHRSSSRRRSTSRCSRGRSPSPNRSQRKPVAEQPAVCVYQLRGACSFGDDCANYHSTQGLPYQWQWCSDYIKDDDDDDSDDDGGGDDGDDAWKDFDKKYNVSIEQDFCNPEKDGSPAKVCFVGKVHVDFDLMAFEGKNSVLSARVRRLETDAGVSTLRKFATSWVWYRKSLTGSARWQKHDLGDELEQQFVVDSCATCRLAGKKRVVDFEKMRELDGRGVTWRIRRRPAANHDDGPSHDVGDPVGAGTGYPTCWDLTAYTGDDYCLVQIFGTGPTSEEYRLVAEKFHATLPTYPIKSVKRIQNRLLWEDFSRLRSRLARKKGNQRDGDVDVRQLFHGTQSKYAEAICQQGFDWRVSGMSVGTKYGKGSYFARDALTSLPYCFGSSKMFLVQVIVGDFTAGSSTYVRPPAKNRSDDLHKQVLYDSCVDSVSNPAIFVVFQQCQAYPEYLIEF